MPGADWLVDVLQTLFADIFEDDVCLAANALVDSIRDADTSGFGDGFQSSRNVDAVAIDVITIDNNVAEIDANS